MRTVILHGHMFKNAGTTFDWSLERNFGKEFCDHRDDMDMRKGRTNYLTKYLKAHPEIRALSSHHLNFPTKAPRKYRYLNCYLVRNPITRIRSVYNFEKQQKSDSLGAKTAKKLTFLDYTLWRMRDDVPNTIRNYQTTYLSASQPEKGKVSVNHDHFLQAISYLRENPFIGLVDRYDESMVVFEDQFAKLDIELDLSYKPQNVLDLNDKSEQEKTEAVLTELGSEANNVISKNLYDFRLYYQAQLALDARISQISRFEDKLTEFRSRCSAL